MSIAQSANGQTPLTLIGGSGFHTAVKIDWISITIPLSISYSLYPSGLSHDAIDWNAPQGYTVARKFTDGRIEAINPDRPDMGRHVIYSGSCLNEIESSCSLSGKEILKYYVSHGANITRLDVAVDALNSRFNIRRANSDFKSGKAVTKAKKSRFMEDENDGQTVYIGSRNSEAMLRIYDKAKESNLTGDWIRFELECKDSKALQVAAMIARLDDDMGQLIQSLIKGFIDFPKNKIYQQIMKEKPTIIVRAKDTSTDTLKWLMDVAAPKLGEVAAMANDPFLIDHFVTLAQDEFNRLRASVNAGKFAEFEAKQRG